MSIESAISEQAQADLMVIRARAGLVKARTMLVNSARGLTKSFGERLPSCGTGQVREELAGQLSTPLQKALGPLLAEVESLSASGNTTSRSSKPERNDIRK